MAPTLDALPDDALDAKFRLTLGFALAELLPLVAVFGWLGIMAGYLQSPLPPAFVDWAGPSIAIVCLASLGIAPLSLMITVVTNDQFKRQLGRFGDPAAVRREVLEALRRELRDRRGGPGLRAVLGVSPETWAAAYGDLALAFAPAPLGQMPAFGQDPDDVQLVVTTLRGRPKVNVVWTLRRDDAGRWRLAGWMGAADYLRGRLQPALRAPRSGM